MEAWTRVLSSLVVPARTKCQGDAAASNSFWSLGQQQQGSAAENATKSSSSSKKELSAGKMVLALVIDITLSALISYALVYSFKFLYDQVSDVMDPTKSILSSSGSSNSRLHKLLRKRHLKRHGIEDNNNKQKIVVPPMPSLNEYEMQIAEDVIDPDEMDCTFQDIGGIDKMKQEIWQLAVLPMLMENTVSLPKGLLLYGRPGTGKTMIAKAIAHEAHAVFIAVQPSKIMNKWYGESNKYVAAVFSLAHKLAPSILFMDEIDAFLSCASVDSSTGSVNNSLRSEFLTQWDGITTASGTKKTTSNVLVLAATNRPQHLDPAVLRRLPRTFCVPLPDSNGRLDLIKMFLKKEQVNASRGLTKDAERYLETVAIRETRGYSGSDLKELCHAASLEAIHEAVAEVSRKAVMEGLSSEKARRVAEDMPDTFRPISRGDLEKALAKVKRTGHDAHAFGREEEMKHDIEQELEDIRRQQSQQDQQTALLRSLALAMQMFGNGPLQPPPSGE